MRTSFTILTFLISVSCSTTKNFTTEQVIGKYQWNGIYGVGATIELKADQTFEYNWQTGLVWGTTFGTWGREGTRIILNSELQPPENGNANFAIIKTESNNSDSLSIKVVGPDNESVAFASCVIKQDTITLSGAVTDLQGEAKLPRLETDSLIISFVGYKTIRYKLDSSMTTYVFRMEEGNEYFEHFANETWRYKNERLYDPSIKKDKYVKMDYYEKIK